MNCRAAVLTGEGTAALATIMVAGPDAETVLGDLLTTALPAPGERTLTHLQDARGRIDQIVAAQEEPERFALHCHGNPLIIERIMSGLQDRGAQLAEGHALLTPRNTLIEREIDQALAVTRCLRGAAFLSRQRDDGLLPCIRRWHENPPSPTDLRNASRLLLERHDPARMLLEGCRVVLAGPPNSGKSTLFNRLLGIDKSIVTDIEGTTRDWVDGRLSLPDLHLHLIDTPGLDARLAQQPDGHLDQAAQAQVQPLLEKADVFLLVLDNSRPGLPDSLPLTTFPPRRTLVALNKCDRPACLAETAYDRYASTHRISALENTGLPDLLQGLRACSGLDSLDIALPAPFTSRQRTGIAALAEADTPSAAAGIVRELLYGAA